MKKIMIRSMTFMVAVLTIWGLSFFSQPSESTPIQAASVVPTSHGETW